MANEIIEKIDEFGTAVEQMRQKYDESQEKLEKGLDILSKEKEVEAEKWNKEVGTLQEEIKRLNDEKERDKSRLEILEALADRPKGTPTEQLEQKHLQTWVKYVRGGMQDNRLRSEVEDLAGKIMEAKADTVLIGTALQGGNAVPTEISRSIETLVLNQSEIVANVKNVTAGTSDYNELVTIRGANGGFVGEAGSRAQTNAPNLRKVTVTHGELYAYPKVSNWSLNDIFFDVQRWLVEDIAETSAVTLSTSIYSGDGSDNLTGMTNGAPVATDDYASPMRAAAVYEYIPCGNSPVTSLAGDDLIDLQVAVRSRYQMNAKWAMSSVTQGAVRKLKDSNNQYLWQPNYQVGQPATLLGKPIFTWEDLPTIAANSLSVAYGDFNRAYVLAKIGPMGMVRDEVTAPGYVNFFSYQRYGGIPLNNDAVKFLKMSAT
jgi:HK97 family phage major capsid protein